MKKLKNRDFGAAKTIKKRVKTVNFSLPLNVKTRHFRQFQKSGYFEKLHKKILWECQKEYLGPVKRNTSLLLDYFMIRTVSAPCGAYRWRIKLENILLRLL